MEQNRHSSSDFTFTNIADTNGQFSFVGLSPVINEQGTVAFDADLDSGGYGIFINNGGVITSIVDNKGVFSTFGSYALNDNGTVAFTADLDALNLETGGRGLFTGNGGAISDEGTRWASINDRGTVAYGAFLANNNLSIYTGNGGATTLIADSTGPLKNLQLPAINNSGTVALNADFDTGGNGIFVSKGGVINNVVDTSGAFSIVRAVSINDNDAIAFGADLDGGGEGVFTLCKPSNRQGNCHR